MVWINVSASVSPRNGVYVQSAGRSGVHTTSKHPAGGFPVDRRRRQSSIALNHIAQLPIPRGLEYPLTSQMHFGVVRPRLEARGRPFARSPRSCSRPNLRILGPLAWGPQGQPSPLETPHGRPGVQGIFSTSRGQIPHGWPMVYHSMATGFPIPWGCCLALSAFLLCSV